VKLPPFLINKWQQEGRLQQQMQNLDVFFQRYRFPRAPRYYLMSWHADWIRRFGIDGFRADTVKHVEPELWAELKQVASDAYAEWKQNHPQKFASVRRFIWLAKLTAMAFSRENYFIWTAAANWLCLMPASTH
jgi:alpha-amylase